MVRSTRHAEHVNSISFNELREVMGESFEDALRTGIATVFAQMGLWVAQTLLDSEVQSICGPKHSRKEGDQPVRWGYQLGSTQIRGSKEKIMRPRVRTAGGKHEIDLEVYSALNNPDFLNDQLLARLGTGVSTRDYSRTLDKRLAKHGVSKSAVSRRTIAATKKALEEFHLRRWHGVKFVAILIDGVSLGKTHVVAAVGIDKSGQKHILGWQLGSTESQVVCRDLLRGLIDAGLDPNGTYLFVLDGSKALRQAVKLVFGEQASVQRCQEHKIRDVEGYLPTRLRKKYRIKMQVAFNETSYSRASERLQKLRFELLSVSEPAANSLTEGLEETLTLHRLGITGGVRQSLRTTNIIESAFSRLRQYTRNVSNWQDTEQVNRWMGFSLQKVEKGFRRLPGYRQLARVQRQLKQVQTALQSPNS